MSKKKKDLVVCEEDNSTDDITSIPPVDAKKKDNKRAQKRAEKQAKKVRKEELKNMLPEERKRAKKADKKERIAKKREELKNKPNSKCCSCRCCITAAVLSVILLVGGVFGGAYFAYGHFAEPVLGMSLFEAIDVLSGLYKGDEEKIVTNAYDPVADMDAFLLGISKTLYLSETMTREQFLELISGNTEDSESSGDGTGPDSDTDTTPQESETQGTTPEGENPETPQEGGGAFDNLLDIIKFNFAPLKDFEEGDNTAFVITDKMLAAIFNEVLTSSGLLDQLTSKFGEGAANAISIKQVIIHETDETTRPTMSFTICVSVEDIVSGLLSSAGIPDIGKSIINWATPKQLFLTGTITPLDQTVPKVQLNVIEPELMEKVIKAIDNIMLNGFSPMPEGELTPGEGQQSLSSILSKVGDTIYSAFNKIQSMTGEGSIVFGRHDDVGSVNMHMFGMAINMMGIKDISETDFLLMLKHIHSIDNSGMSAQEFIEKNLKNRPNADPVDGDFQQDMTRLLSIYGIKASDLTEPLTPSNFIQQTAELFKKVKPIPNIDINNPPTQAELEEMVKKMPFTKPIEELNANSRLSDRTLALIMRDYMEKNTTSDNALPFKMSIEEVVLDGKNKMIRMTGYIDTSTLIKGLPEGLFPKQMYMTIETPYTRAAEGEIGSKLYFNLFNENDGDMELSKEASNRSLNTMFALLNAQNPEGGWTEAKICAQLDKYVYDALANMMKGINGQSEGDSSVDVDKLITDTLKDGYIQLPNAIDIALSQEKIAEQINTTINLPIIGAKIADEFIKVNKEYLSARPEYVRDIVDALPNLRKYIVEAGIPIAPAPEQQPTL